MLPNEIFALKCRERYAEDGLIVDQSNGEFAHCPLPKGLGDSGYYLLHDDHQWQGLLQSKDLGRRCYWIPDAKLWLMKANFVEGYFELWDIFDEFNKPGEEHRRKLSEALKGLPISEEHKKKISEGNKGRPVTEETRNKIREGMKGEKNHKHGKKSPELSERNRRKFSGTNWWSDGCGNTKRARDYPGEGWKLGRKVSEL